MSNCGSTDDGKFSCDAPKTDDKEAPPPNEDHRSSKGVVFALRKLREHFKNKAW